MAEVWRKIPGVSVNVGPGGGVANVKAVGKNIADLALTNACDVYDAREGKKPFDQAYPGIMNVASLYDHFFYFVVPANSDIHSVQDLKGKRICPGGKGSGSDLMVQRLLQLHGMSYSDMKSVGYSGHADSVSLMRDGHLDAWLPLSSLPMSSIMELATTSNIRMVPFSDEDMAKLHQINRGYFPLTVPAGSYKGVDKDVKILGTVCNLSINRKVPDGVAYQMTKLLVENFESLQKAFDCLKKTSPAVMVKNVGIPFHPGTLKYYKEKGLIK
jgi:TRAP transporter TAXI family solute receptor